MAEERIAGHDELLTIKEQGYDIVFPKFFYLAAPNSTDDAVVAALNEGLAKVIENAGLQEYASTALVNLGSMTPDETEAYYLDQLEIYRSYLADYIE